MTADRKRARAICLKMRAADGVPDRSSALHVCIVFARLTCADLIAACEKRVQLNDIQKSSRARSGRRLAKFEYFECVT